MGGEQLSFEQRFERRYGRKPFANSPPAESKPLAPRKPKPPPIAVRDPSEARESKLPGVEPVNDADLAEVRAADELDSMSPFAVHKSPYTVSEECAEALNKIQTPQPRLPWMENRRLDASHGIVDNAERSPNRSKEEMKMEQVTPQAATQPTKFQRASRKRGKLRVLLTGPSGSGKTFTALMLAEGMCGNWCVVDTENESSTDYAAPDDVEVGKRGAWIFGLKVIRKPYTVEKYLTAFEQVIAEGYDGIIIDSISHEWIGEGGLLSQKDALDSAGRGNSYTNFASITKMHERFKAMILQSPIHLIATGRSKQDHVIEKDANGKNTVRKVGLKMEQRDGMEYEFTVAFEMGMDHSAIASKDRTQMWPSSLTPFPIDESIGKQLIEWRTTGGDSTVDVVEAPAELQVDSEPQPVAAPVPANGTPTSINKTAEAMAICKANGSSFSAEMQKRNWTGAVTPERLQEIIDSFKQ